ncbi:hypothetical protein [Streptomyces sp. NPDC048489]
MADQARVSVQDPIVRGAAYGVGGGAVSLIIGWVPAIFDRGKDG